MAGVGLAKEECCWCGKPYHRDERHGTFDGRAAQQQGMLNSSGPANAQAQHPLVVSRVQGPLDVRLDKTFYVAGVDERASLVVVVLDPPTDRQLVLTVWFHNRSSVGGGGEGGDEGAEDSDELVRWQEEIHVGGSGGGEPGQQQDAHWLELSALRLRPGSRTRVRWSAAHWPIPRQSGPAQLLSRGSVRVVVGQSLRAVAARGAVRVVRPRGSTTAHLEEFGDRGGGGQPQPVPLLPYGFFVNWGGWLGRSLDTLNETIGNMVHPVPPFDPGGLDAVERYLGRAVELGLRWEHDMRHLGLPRLVSEEVQRLASLKPTPSPLSPSSSSSPPPPPPPPPSPSSAILSWYVSDEPDGAGHTPGVALGTSPALVGALVRAARAADPWHPVSISLNCRDSARYYAATGADILLLDPYPIGLDTRGCSMAHYGCCGCDGCAGRLADVSERLQHVRQLAGSGPLLGLVAQAFGGPGSDEQHWARGPTASELRAMTYLGLMHGAHAGVSYWLREEHTAPPLLQAARALAAEVQELRERLLLGAPVPVPAGELRYAPHPPEGGGGGGGGGGRYSRGGALQVRGWCLEHTAAPPPPPGTTAGGGHSLEQASSTELTLLLVHLGDQEGGGDSTVDDDDGDQPQPHQEQEGGGGELFLSLELPAGASATHVRMLFSHSSLDGSGGGGSAGVRDQASQQLPLPKLVRQVKPRGAAAAADTSTLLVHESAGMTQRGEVATRVYVVQYRPGTACTALISSSGAAAATLPKNEAGGGPGSEHGHTEL
jgi:hypothetical protein